LSSGAVPLTKSFTKAVGLSWWLKPALFMRGHGRGAALPEQMALHRDEFISDDESPR
jgi:hypothetical protein